MDLFKDIEKTNERWIKDMETHIKSGNTYYTKQIEKPTEQYKFLKKILENIGMKNKKVLDTGTGIGRNLIFLAEDFRQTEFYASDISPPLIEQLKKMLPENKGRIDYAIADICKLETAYNKDYFDITLAMSVISLLPSYEQAIESLLAVTKPGGHVIICTAMSDSDIDFIIKEVYETMGQEIQTDWNLWSLPKLKKFIEKLRIKSFESQDFEISIDLPKHTNGIGTYTERLNNGKRIQITGNILLNWKFLILQK